MRIAIVHPYPWPEVRRGAERYLDDLSRYLTGQGHDVTIVTGRPRSTAEGAEPAPRTEHRTDGVTIERRPRFGAGPAGRFGVTEVETFGARALEPLARLRPDVVHALTPTAALAGLVIRRPTLYTVLGHPDRGQLPTQALPRHAFRLAARHATATATLSRASATALAASVGGTRGRPSSGSPPRPVPGGPRAPHRATENPLLCHPDRRPQAGGTGGRRLRPAARNSTRCTPGPVRSGRPGKGPLRSRRSRRPGHRGRRRAGTGIPRRRARPLPSRHGHRAPGRARGVRPGPDRVPGERDPRGVHPHRGDARADRRHRGVRRRRLDTRGPGPGSLRGRPAGGRSQDADPLRRAGVALGIGRARSDRRTRRCTRICSPDGRCAATSDRGDGCFGQFDSTTPTWSRRPLLR